MQNKKSCPPDPRFNNALQFVGYTPMSAMMDIMDNSLDAVIPLGSSYDAKIGIEAINYSNDKPTGLLIWDNGVGIANEKICDIYTFGVSEKSSKEALGCFGFGLKGGVMALGKKCRMFSKTANDDNWAWSEYDYGKQTEEGNWDIPWGYASKEDEKNIQQLLGGANHGSVLIINELKTEDLNKKVDGLYDKLQKEINRIYRIVLRENKNITISIGGNSKKSKKDRIISHESVSDWLQYPDNEAGIKSKFYHGKENFGIEWREFDGQEYGLRASHTQTVQGLATKSAKDSSNWASGVKTGNYPKACSFIRNDREVSIETSGENAFWSGSNNMVANAYFEIYFQDGKHISPDFGKKGIVTSEKFRAHLKEVTDSMMKQCSKISESKKSKSQEDVATAHEKAFSSIYKSPRKEKSSNGDVGEKETKTLHVKEPKARTKYVGSKLDGLEIHSENGVKSNIKIKHGRLRDKRALWVKEPIEGQTNGWEVIFNESNDFVNKALKEQPESTYAYGISMIQALETCMSNEEDIYEVIANMGEGLNQLVKHLKD